MTNFVKIDRATGDVLKQRSTNNLERVFNKSTVWIELEINNKPIFDPNSQRLVPTLAQPDLSDLNVDVSPTAKRVQGWEAIALTAQELAGIQTSLDVDFVASSSGRKAMWLLVELIDKLFDQATIQPTDFTPDVRQAYTDIKTRVDRIKA